MAESVLLPTVLVFSEGWLRFKQRCGEPACTVQVLVWDACPRASCSPPGRRPASVVSLAGAFGQLRRWRVRVGVFRGDLQGWQCISGLLTLLSSLCYQDMLRVLLKEQQILNNFSSSSWHVM